MGEDEFIRRATQQLGAIFGHEALQPKKIFYQDWSREPYTANAADQQPQTRHPEYGLTLEFGDDWGGKLAHISSESSYLNGGLIEGALESGLAYAKQIANLDVTLNDQEANPHKASMDWDWLD